MIIPTTKPIRAAKTVVQDIFGTWTPGPLAAEINLNLKAPVPSPVPAWPVAVMARSGDYGFCLAVDGLTDRKLILFLSLLLSL